MKIFNTSYDQIHIDEALTVTIGNFDGLHVGHQQLIQRVLSFKDTKHAVLTFDPHPLSVIRKQMLRTLTQKNDKIKLFSDFDLDYIIMVDFTLEFSNLKIDDFILFLKKIGVKRIVVGRDARFGYRGEGSIKNLEEHFLVEVVEDLLFNNTRVSTTYVKDLLTEGDLDAAHVLLNRNYRLQGEVVHGNKVGHKLGFPTANIDYDHYYLPKNGVYYVKVDMDGISYDAMANIGFNPTVNFTADCRLEVYILDFHSEIYGKSIAVEFIKYLRSEIKFKSRKELIDQLKHDEEVIRTLSL
jgi:riboflavin kinase / FMN adenylyltransferase